MVSSQSMLPSVGPTDQRHSPELHPVNIEQASVGCSSSKHITESNQQGGIY